MEVKRRLRAVLLMAATDVALRMRSESLLTVLKSVAQACATGELVKAVYDCLTVDTFMMITFGLNGSHTGHTGGYPDLDTCNPYILPQTKIIKIFYAFLVWFEIPC
jgi:hypothetical protein